MRARRLEHLREGDVLLVWKLDLLSRSLKDLLAILDRVRAAGAGFRSLTEAVDTTTPAGHMLLQILGSFADHAERAIRERTRVGLAAARERGKVPGRKAKLSAARQAEVIRQVQAGEKTAAEVARLFGVHRSSISRLLATAGLGDLTARDHHAPRDDQRRKVPSR